MTRTEQTEKNIIYFCTFTCHKWLPLFEITNIYDGIYKWFDYMKKYDNKIVSYVIMPNHFHGMIYISQKSKTINTILGNAKRFLAYEIVSRLEKAGRNDLLQMLKNSVPAPDRKKGKRHQVFELSSDIKSCIYPIFLVQKLRYIHLNPVKGKWKLVENFADYQHSSAGFYETGEQGIYKDVVHYQTIPYVGDMMAADVGKRRG